MFVTVILNKQKVHNSKLHQQCHNILKTYKSIQNDINETDNGRTR